MKTIGLIGGTTWLSTIEYYRLVNQFTNDRLGSLNSARLLLYSVNFEEFKPTDSTDWEQMAEHFIAIANSLEKAGAECLMLCANTTHLMADSIQQAIRIPLIHIVRETGRELKRSGIRKAGLLGTRFTMEKPFFKEKLLDFGIEPIIPDPEDRDFIHGSIYSELGKGIYSVKTKERFLDIIGKLNRQGADGIILGCTEFPLLIKQEDCRSPLFDTTAIHVRAAVDFALS